MLFYGNGIVWDKENGTRLCKFINGEFSTSDVRVQNALKKSYRHEIEPEDLNGKNEEKVLLSKDEIIAEDTDVEIVVDELMCVCGFKAKNLAGMKAHKRKCEVE